MRSSPTIRLSRDPLAQCVTATLSIVQVNVRGGGDRYSFYVSGDRNIEQGVFFNSDNSQKSVRTNFTVNPNDKLDFTVNVNWQDGRLRLPDSGRVGERAAAERHARASRTCLAARCRQRGVARRSRRPRRTATRTTRMPSA